MVELSSHSRDYRERALTIVHQDAIQDRELQIDIGHVQLQSREMFLFGNGNHLLPDRTTLSLRTYMQGLPGFTGLSSGKNFICRKVNRAARNKNWSNTTSE
jgi:hypothetical protein